VVVDASVVIAAASVVVEARVVEVVVGAVEVVIGASDVDAPEVSIAVSANSSGVVLESSEHEVREPRTRERHG
jgi:hypothetical protein